MLVKNRKKIQKTNAQVVNLLCEKIKKLDKLTDYTLLISHGSGHCETHSGQSLWAAIKARPGKRRKVRQPVESYKKVKWQSVPDQCIPQNFC